MHRTFSVAIVFWSAIANAEVRIDSIKVMLFDRQKNKIVPLNKLPDSFGRDADLLISVGVRGEVEAFKETPKSVIVDLTAPTLNDEIGEWPSLNLRLERPFEYVGETGLTYYPFLTSYPCHRKVTITARLGSSSKSVKMDFACAD
jgi:hypothetical protein